jgi:hypothetical protein
MTRYLSLLKNRRVRASVVSGLRTSAVVPDSDLTFVNNSQGASAAIAELSGLFDDVLENLELDGTYVGSLSVSEGIIGF